MGCYKLNLSKICAEMPSIDMDFSYVEYICIAQHMYIYIYIETIECICIAESPCAKQIYIYIYIYIYIAYIYIYLHTNIIVFVTHHLSLYHFYLIFTYIHIYIYTYIHIYIHGYYKQFNIFCIYCICISMPPQRLIPCPRWPSGSRQAEPREAQLVESRRKNSEKP